MADAYKEVFELPNAKIQITSVVMDNEDFDNLCDRLRGVFNIANKERSTEEMVERLKQAKHIPMMAKGTKTAEIFEEFGIETDLACFIVRGQGKKLAQQIITKASQQLGL